MRPQYIMASSFDLDTITTALADFVHIMLSVSPEQVEHHQSYMDIIDLLFEMVKSISSEVVQTTATPVTVVDTLSNMSPVVMKHGQHTATFSDEDLDFTLISSGSGTYVSVVVKMKVVASTRRQYQLTVFNAPGSQYLYASRSRARYDADIGDIAVMVDSMSFSSSTSVVRETQGDRNVHVSYSCCKQFVGSDATTKSYLSGSTGCTPVTYQQELPTLSRS
jgi:hypothetical protein